MKKKQLQTAEESKTIHITDNNSSLLDNNTSTLNLFLEISKGNLHSFELLHETFYNKLLYFCISYVKFREPAEEIVSDVFVKLWMKRAQLAEIRKHDFYLFVSVKNASINYLKKNAGAKIIPIHKVEKNYQGTPPSPHEEMQKKELMKAMQQAVDSLPEQCRIIFTLVKEYGMKNKEVAEILQLSPRTVETQIFRAVKKLDKILGPYTSTNVAQRKKTQQASIVSGFLIFFGAVVRSF